MPIHDGERNKAARLVVDRGDDVRMMHQIIISRELCKAFSLLILAQIGTGP